MMRTATKAMAVGALLLGITGTAGAADITFTAEFKPSANTSHNRFVNTTPQSGFCVNYPLQCNGAGLFSVSVPIGDVTFDLVANEGGRNAAHIKLPTSFIPVRLTHEETGRLETLNFRVSGFSSSYSTNGSVTDITGVQDVQAAHHALWGLSWAAAPSGCTHSGVGAYREAWYHFMWGFPQNQGACTKVPRFDLPLAEQRFRLDGGLTSIAYELVTPNPLRMPSGVYRGTHTFTVGAGGDFDFGDKATVERNTIEVEFELYVDHLFELHIPPGSDRAVLEPPGGWGAWINRGRPPTRLHRDVPLSLSTSVPFSATLTCPDGPAVNGRCQIRDETRGTAASLDVSLTMPRIRTEAGLPAERLPLRADQPIRLEPEGVTIMMGSQLHIDVDQQEVTEMLRHPGARYRGNITVVFESEPEP